MLVALGFAALVALRLDAGVEMSKVLAASAVVYLGAAALKKPVAAWPVFFATFIVIGVPEVLKLGFDATWAVLGIGIVLLVYGLVRRAERLPVQTLATLGFGGAAVIALLINPVVGSYLVAAA